MIRVEFIRTVSQQLWTVFSGSLDFISNVQCMTLNKLYVNFLKLNEFTIYLVTVFKYV